VLANLVAISTNASPDGWIGVGRSNTIGNNVDARLDLDNSDRDYADSDVAPPRPTGTTNGGVLTFDFGLDLSANSSPSATSNRNSAVVNAFYWANWVHDRLYDLSFTEAAGNCQKTNFNRGGIENDPILVDVQNPYAPSLSTQPQDGSGTRLALGLWTHPNPTRDAAFDHEILIHELIHLLTARRVGQGTGLSGEQPRSLAEGWGDFLAMCLLAESGDDLSGAFPYGAYSTYLWVFMHPNDHNYHYGMRRYPYSTDMGKNPLTFNDLDLYDATAYTNVAINPMFELSEMRPEEEHNAGEIWASALWEVFANLATRHGFSEGRETILKLVLDGMSLSPPNPTFLQARDALILADRVNNGGENLNEIWAGFAKRGIGWSAVEPVLTVSNTWIAASAFDVPVETNLVWSYLTGNGVYSSPAIGQDGTVYVGSTDGKFYALDGANGTKKWDFGPSATYSNFNSTPAIGADGTIYARRNNGYLYALHPDGVLKWSYLVDYDSWVSPAVGPDQTIYVAGTTALYAINSDGTLKWTNNTGNTIYSSPAIGTNGAIYFGGMDGKLYGLAPAGTNLSSSWPVTLPDSIASSPAIGADGTVYVGCDNGRVYAIHGATGSQVWERFLGGHVQSSPAVGPDGAIYVGTHSNSVYALDGATGSQLWSRATGHDVRSSPVVAANGLVYCGSDDSKLYALNAADGTVEWSYNSGGTVFSSPAIGPDGTVYYGSGNGRVYATRGMAGPARSVWRGFRRTCRRTADAGVMHFPSGRHWSNGVFEMQIVADGSVPSVELETSADLSTWTSLGTVALTDGAIVCYDIFATNQTPRFYRASSGGKRTTNPFGYITQTIPAGLSMVGIQLYATNSSVRSLFAGITNAITVSKYHPATSSYSNAVYSGGAWSGPDFTLVPGEGVFVSNTNGSAFEITFKGEVLQGFLSRAVSTGYSIRSSPTPEAGAVPALLGFTPVANDEVQKYIAGSAEAFLYFSGFGWVPSEPQAGVGEAFWLNPATSRLLERTFFIWP
jgi:outer membrane protein assembly factor BamB